MTSDYMRVYSHSKKNVNTRRVNKEQLRVKLQRASFVAVPKLVKRIASSV